MKAHKNNPRSDYNKMRKTFFFRTIPLSIVGLLSAIGLFFCGFLHFVEELHEAAPFVLQGFSFITGIFLLLYLLTEMGDLARAKHYHDFTI